MDQNEKILTNEKENIICQPDISFGDFEFITPSKNEMKVKRVKKEAVSNIKKIKKGSIIRDPLAY